MNVKLTSVLLLFAASSFAQTPHPALLVLNKAEATLAIVDPAAMKVIGKVPTGTGPHEIAVSADGKLAFVANYGAQQPGNTISIIDVPSQKELKRSDLGPLRRPHGITEHGGKIWFTAEANKAIARLDPQSQAVDWLMGTGQDATHMLVIAADGKVFTANIASNTISVIEPGEREGQWRITQISVGKGPEAIDLSPDGKELWTAHSQDGGVSIIDVAGKNVKQTLPTLTKRSNRLKFTPDGKLVLISDLDGGELIMLDAATRKERKRLKLGNMPEGILIQPDGSRAYVATAQSGEVVIIDLKTLEPVGRIHTGRGPDGMAWIH